MRYFIISVLILILGISGALDPVKTAFRWSVSPVQLGLKEFASDLKNTFSFFARVSDLRNDNIKLLEENLSLKAEIISLIQHEQENQTLREQLELKEEDPDRELLMASVLGNPGDLTGSTFYLDKGFNSGVSQDNMVVTGKYLVGVVRKVDANRSLVELITSPDLSITVVDLEHSTSGICEGRHGISLEMLRILQAENIGVGNMVVTSGKDGIFLPGFIVGRVSEVKEVPAETLKSAMIEPVIDLKNLEKVFVVLR